MKMKVKTRSQSNVNSDTKAKKAVLSTEDLERLAIGLVFGGVAIGGGGVWGRLPFSGK